MLRILRGGGGEQKRRRGQGGRERKRERERERGEGGNKYDSLSFMRNLSGSLDRGRCFLFTNYKGNNTRPHCAARNDRQIKEKRNDRHGMRRSYDLDRTIYQARINFDGRQMRYRARKKKRAPSVYCYAVTLSRAKCWIGAERRGNSNGKQYRQQQQRHRRCR